MTFASHCDKGVLSALPLWINPEMEILKIAIEAIAGLDLIKHAPARYMD